MIHETQVTLTQTELQSILILCAEFIRRDAQGVPTDTYRTEHTRQIWLKNCNSLIIKMGNAFNHCLVTNEQTPINY